MWRLFIWLVLTLIAVWFCGGCAMKRVMRDCVSVQAEGYERFSICEEQYKIWR